MTAQISRRKTIFLVRLMVIVTSFYFIIFSPTANIQWEIYGYIFIASYLLTNLLVAHIPEKYFHDDKIFYGFILCDSILLPAGIYVSGYTGSECPAVTTDGLRSMNVLNNNYAAVRIYTNQKGGCWL